MDKVRTQTLNAGNQDRLTDDLHREGEGFLLVYSITSRASFERIERFRTQILRVQDRDDVPMVLVGNKVDMAATSREVSAQEAEALARQMGCNFSGGPLRMEGWRALTRDCH